VISDALLNAACIHDLPFRSYTRIQQTINSIVAEKLETSLQRTERTDPGDLDQVQEVIVILSSSRSGSSLLVEILKSCTKFLHFCAEINPFIRLAGLAWPHSGVDSDALLAGHCAGRARSVLKRQLRAEVGRPVAAGDPADIGEIHTEQLYRRLCLQWPLEDFTVEEVRMATMQALQSVRRFSGRPCDWSSELSSFYIFFLLELQANHPSVNPYYYDLDRQLIARIAPDTALPSGPPSPILVEEPPFVPIRPWRSCDAADLRRYPLVIKTPSNAYRPMFLRALFPNARIRMLHLTRNPAAAINGLVDGWRSGAFHSHYVGAALPDPRHPQAGLADQGWWKFDLPTGWRRHVMDPVERICAFQWCSAQRAILDVRTDGEHYRQLKFEDVLTDFKDNREGLRELRGWLGDECFFRRGLAGRPPIMSTLPPRPGRWRDNEDTLREVLQGSDVRELSDELEYADPSGWI
jgi:hypothetical protein